MKMDQAKTLMTFDFCMRYNTIQIQLSIYKQHNKNASFGIARCNGRNINCITTTTPNTFNE